MAKKTFSPKEVQEMREVGRIDIRLNKTTGNAQILIDGEIVAELRDLHTSAYFDRLSLEETARRYGMAAITRW